MRVDDTSKSYAALKARLSGRRSTCERADYDSCGENCMVRSRRVIEVAEIRGARRAYLLAEKVALLLRDNLILSTVIFAD